MDNLSNILQDDIRQRQKDPLDRLNEELNKARLDPLEYVKQPPIIFSILEQSATQTVERRVFTLGNFSSITGKAKSKKTYLLSSIAAAIIGQKTIFNKFIGHDIGKNKVLYFDTEQGRWDALNVVKRILTLAGVNKDRFVGYALREFEPKTRCELIDLALMQHGDEAGFVVIDGIADLANAINDEDEATRVTSLLLKWSAIYDCHIATVIHQNKNDNFATGHLGTAVMKKAEVIISVTTDPKNKAVSYVECDLIRGGMGFERLKLSIDAYGMPMVDDIKPEIETRLTEEIRTEIIDEDNLPY